MSIEYQWNDTDRENKITQRKTSPSDTMSTKNPIPTDVGLCNERSATNCLSHGKARQVVKLGDGWEWFSIMFHGRL
jgi:hypothetical protein